MKHSTEFSILLASCRLSLGLPAMAEAEKVFGSGLVNWDLLYRSADMHSVRPQLAQMVAVLSPGLVPVEFRARVNKAFQDNLLDQISYVAEYMRVNRVLEKEGITAVPFKGFRLANDYYGELGDREAGDIDVFTDLCNLDRIINLMTGEGYVVEKALAGFSMSELVSRAGECNFDRFVGQKCLYHFEYHWAISSPAYGMGITMEDLSSQVVPGEIQGRKVIRFTPSADLLLTVMHHGGKDPFMELKYVQDIAAIMKHQESIDWNWVLGQARRFRLERLIFVALRLANELFATPVPDALTGKVFERVTGTLAANRIRFMSDCLGYWHPRITINDWLFRIRTRTGARIKIRLTLYIAGVVLRRFLWPGGGHQKEAA
jgi:hypothetical protein